VKVNYSNVLLITYLDASFVVLDQEGRETLQTAQGLGLGGNVDLKNLQVGNTDSFVTLSGSQLTQWTHDRDRLGRPIWSFKTASVGQGPAVAFEFDINGFLILVAYANGTMKLFDLETMQTSEKTFTLL
jgi:hypothetical protein